MNEVITIAVPQKPREYRPGDVVEINGEPMTVIEPKPFVCSPGLAAAAAAFHTEHQSKSFSARHPELGKMIRCPYCTRRHRSSEAYACGVRQLKREALIEDVSQRAHDILKAEGLA